MKTTFQHFYPNIDINSTNINNENILVCLDANVLLNVYRYSQEIKSDLLLILKKQKNIFIPYNAALEFNYNKKTVLHSVINQKETIEKLLSQTLEKTINEFNSILDNNKELRCMKSKEVLKDIKNTFQKEIKEIENKFYTEDLKKYYDLYADLSDNDSISNEFANILEGHVGEPYTLEEMQSIISTAKERFEKNIPPGFDDKNKDRCYTYFYKGNSIHFESKYSDYIIWKQIIDYVNTNKYKFNYILFITDDSTDDWIYRVNGHKIGIRAELRNEFFDLTKKYIKIVDTNTYLKYLKDSNSEFIDSKVQPKKHFNHQSDILNNDFYFVRDIERQEDKEQLTIGSNHSDIFIYELKKLKEQIFRLQLSLEEKEFISHSGMRYYRNKINELKKELLKLDRFLNLNIKKFISPMDFLSLSSSLKEADNAIIKLEEFLKEKLINIPF